MNYTTFVLLLAAFGCASAIMGIGRDQAVKVTGQLMCNGKPAVGVKVKLYEIENIIDTKLDEQYSDESGNFVVEGWKSEITRIDPRVNIYHRCDYSVPACYRKVAINIPKNFIASGRKANNPFHIGTLNLANKFPGESVDCLN